MGERTSYTPGSFSWVDLTTTDPESAKTFYESLFGWTHEDVPTGNGGVYTMFSLKGKSVAAVSGQMEQEREQGIPPHWNNYVTVEDVDASAAKASKLGGTVMMEPFDVMDVGRMAVIADPTGAVFMLWQPKTNIGAGIVNEPGSLTWNELGTKDTAKAKQFYSSLFGWDSEDFDNGAYTVVRVGDRSNGGIRPQTEQEANIPPNWLPYFAVESADESAAKASELGGTALVPPMDVPVADDSRIAVIADPQGAVFGLFSGPMDP
jgi:predicted enzyme related to lactoylglutathione lyase